MQSATAQHACLKTTAHPLSLIPSNLLLFRVAKQPAGTGCLPDKTSMRVGVQHVLQLVDGEQHDGIGGNCAHEAGGEAAVETRHPALRPQLLRQQAGRQAGRVRGHDWLRGTTPWFPVAPATPQ